jgi:hypothetical protein
MYIQQKQLKNLTESISSNKVMVIYGPRRCGKTTLLNRYLRNFKEPYILATGEDIFIQQQLSSQSVEKLKKYIGDNKLMAIDEAQKIPNIGLNLKLIVDNIKDIKIIATGSSSFDLARQIGEPLVGRKFSLMTYPLAQMEINTIENLTQTKANLENRLIYGTYPEIILSESNQQKEKFLREIINSYLFKDILELDGLRHSDKIVKLLQLLAFQIGQTVSYNELGAQLAMSKNTVEKYLELLEKSFVLQRLTGYSRNLRKEITKNPRYYFLDNGIRNALINNFNSIDLRNDVGALWENYILMERFKKQTYDEIYTNNYFWRTYDQKEIDLVEEREGKLFAYEFKWKQDKAKKPAEFLETYKNSSFEIINQDNYLDFII